MASSGRIGVQHLLAVTRDVVASGDELKAAVALQLLGENRLLLTPAEHVDLLERACVYGSQALVGLCWEMLKPFPYAGWALALALRCGRADVSRLLLDEGVDLLQAAHGTGSIISPSSRNVPLDRGDTTKGNYNLLLVPHDRSVCSEVFSPFRGNEQLVGGSFSTHTDLAVTCDLVAALAGEGRFDPVVFDDLLRAAIDRADQALDARGGADGPAAEACLGLASRMVTLWHQDKGGDKNVAAVLSTFVEPSAHEEVLALVCESAPEVMLSCIASMSWLQDDVDLVCRLVGHLSAGTPVQNEYLAGYLARNGCMDALRTMSLWPGVLAGQAGRRAMMEAAGAGHAELAAWLLRLGEDGPGAGGGSGAGDATGTATGAGGVPAGTAGVPDGWSGASPDDTMAGLDDLLL